MLSTSDAPERNLPPPLEDDRSIKKTKFRSQGKDGDNPHPLSFRFKLMETEGGVADEPIGKEDFLSRDDEIEFEMDDVVIEKEGILPCISFSRRVPDQFVKPWQTTIVVKLLGRMIGYEALYSRLDSLWANTRGFSVIDLENGYYLIHFINNEDARFALAQGPWIILDR